MKDPRNEQGNDQTVPMLPDGWAIVVPSIDGREAGHILAARAKSGSSSTTRAGQALHRPILDLHCHDLCPGRAYRAGAATHLRIKAEYSPGPR